jgi:hypothetical protein
MIRTMALLAAALPFAAWGEPKTGYVCTESYNVGKEGKKSPVPQRSKTWFNETNTRRETYQDDELTAIDVDGERRWDAYPRIGRLQRFGPSPFGFRSFLAQTTFGAKRLEGKKPVGEEELLGFKCRKFAWHDPGTKGGCMEIPEHDVTCWAYADEGFPIFLRYESTVGLSSEVSAMTLDCPVPAKLFEEPPGLRPVSPIAVPKGDFAVEITEKRWSDQYGWSEATTHRLTREGGTLRYSSDSTGTSPHGTRSTRREKQALTEEKALAELSRYFRQPYWPGVVREAQATWQGMGADVLVYDSFRRTLRDKYWVVDHPDFGTITVKHINEYPTQTQITETARITIGAAK